ncbi:hypothetical protein ACA910_006781 [Epithemia clementina (nom. ined.)]
MPPSPLSRAITAGQWSLATELVRRYPELAHKACTRTDLFDGRTCSQVYPLHEALMDSQAPLSCIQALVQAAPLLLRHPESSFQRLPLHCAFRKSASPDILRYLIAEYPAACQQVDALQRLPLHYALTNGADPEILAMVVQMGGSQAVRSCDYQGWTPVHVAVRYGVSLRFIETLLRAFPEAVLRSTNEGNNLTQLIPWQTKKGGALYRWEVERMIEDTLVALGARPTKLIEESTFTTNSQRNSLNATNESLSSRTLPGPSNSRFRLLLRKQTSCSALSSRTNSGKWQHQQQREILARLIEDTRKEEEDEEEERTTSNKIGYDDTNKNNNVYRQKPEQPRPQSNPATADSLSSPTPRTRKLSRAKSLPRLQPFLSSFSSTSSSSSVSSSRYRRKSMLSSSSTSSLKQPSSRNTVV